MKVHASIKEYEVLFQHSFQFVEDLASNPNAFFVIDENVWNLYREDFSMINEERLLLLHASEENKSIETALLICDSLISMKAKRNTTLVSIGGGIIQDVTGFAANILYRGIAWEFVPTTLLSACDSCIGGKTSINHSSYKNLLGTFYPPDRVHIYALLFKTLSKEDVESGLGEVIKFNIMAGERRTAAVEAAIPDLLRLEESVVNEFVDSSLQYKKSIIEKDEFDKGERVLLNYAHTLGHAFEVSSGYAIPHGTAVALGIVGANAISCNRGMLSSMLGGRIEQLVYRILPTIDISLIDSNIVVDAVRKDKKQIGDGITMVLMDDDYSLSTYNDISVDEIKEACDYIKNFIRSIGNKHKLESS